VAKASVNDPAEVYLNILVSRVIKKNDNELKVPYLRFSAELAGRPLNQSYDI